MKLIVTLGYKEIYGNVPKPEIEDLIGDIPQSILIRFLSLLNAKLYAGQTDEKNQAKILDYILKRNLEEYKRVFRVAINYASTENRKRFQFFTTNANLEFLHLVMIHGKEANHKLDTTPEDELNFFKAYTIITDRLFENVELNHPYNDIQERLQRLTWTSLKDQYLLNKPLQYFTSLVKAKCFFDTLLESELYRPYIDQFLKEIGDPNSLTYLFRYVGLIQSTYEGDEAKCMIIEDKNTEKFLSSLAINVDEYKMRYATQHSGYLGFKDKPLLKFEDKYVVFDWNLFSGKIFHGLIYDIHNNTNLKDIINFKEFKSYVGKEVIEGYLFRRIIKAIFNNLHCKIYFDDGQTDGFPDAIIQIGNKVLIFEIKDAAFSQKAIQSNEYGELKKEIDIKYNNPKKGTGQIIKYLSKLTESELIKLTGNQKIKRRNLHIYPIIIYTDQMFELPGIMKYIQGEFKSRISENQLEINYKKVYPVAFMNLDFFIENLNYLMKIDNRFDLLIEYMSYELIRREKRSIRTNALEDYFDSNDTFERIVINKIRIPQRDNTEYLKTLFDVLEISKNLD
jgi:hypothetical protein